MFSGRKTSQSKYFFQIFSSDTLDVLRLEIRSKTAFYLANSLVKVILVGVNVRFTPLSSSGEMFRRKEKRTELDYEQK